MKRPYTLKKRAESQADTRRRIVEATIDLHGTIGPARTPISMIADRAGVQRKTLYAHFPDERSLYLACSGLALEQDPPPDPEKWRQIADPEERLQKGLAELYAYYDRNCALFGCVLRDAEYHEMTREAVELSFGSAMGKMAEVLAEGLSTSQQPLLRLAMSFYSFRTLIRESDLEPAAAAHVMATTVMRGLG